MANVPTWFLEGGVPAPTKPKKKFVTGIWGDYPTQWNTPMQAFPPVETEVFPSGKRLYNLRRQKGHLMYWQHGVGLIMEQTPWENINVYTKGEWEDHAHSPRGQWEFNCYFTDVYTPYENVSVDPQPKSTRKLRMLNVPEERTVV